jgi:hypothetical protein
LAAVYDTRARCAASIVRKTLEESMDADAGDRLPAAPNPKYT